MQWEGREESSNVEDERGSSGGSGLGGGGFGLPTGAMVGGGGGVVLLIAILLIRFLGGGGLGLPAGGGGGGGQQVARAPDKDEDRMAHFAKVIFHDTEVVWDEQFKKMGKNYKKPVLHLFTDEVTSACGRADAAVGPFYCPADSKVYIDLSFYKLLDQKLHSPGEFARAYVIAHEVGHHVQRLLGYSARVDEIQRTGNKVEANHASVRLELQADYFAGVWAYYARQKYPNMLEKGDLESATNAAFHIGDDVLQQQAGRRVTPDSFTHGTAKQRQRWFLEGFNTGNIPGAARLFDLPYNQL